MVETHDSLTLNQVIFFTYRQLLTLNYKVSRIEPNKDDF